MEVYKVLLTAKRYIRLQVRSFSFWLVVISPLLSGVAVLLVATALRGQEATPSSEQARSKIVILFEPELIAGATLLAQSLELDAPTGLLSGLYTAELIAVTPRQYPRAKSRWVSRMRHGEISGIVSLQMRPTGNSETGSIPTTELFVEPLLLTRDQLTERLRLASSMFTELQIVQFPEREAVLNPAHFELESTIRNADDPELRKRLTVSGLLILFLFTTRVVNSAVARPLCTALTKEKEQRSIEVLLTAYSTTELIVGRVAGAVVLGLSIQLVFTALASGLAYFTGAVSAAVLVWLYLLMALELLLICLCYFCAGSVAHDTQSAIRLLLPVDMLMFCGSFALIAVAQSPDSETAASLTQIPIVATTAIPLRIALAESNNYLHYGTTVALTVSLILAMLFLTARLVDKEALILNERFSFEAVLTRLFRGKRR